MTVITAIKYFFLKRVSLPANLNTVEGVELVVFGVVAGNAKRDGIWSGSQLGLQAKDLHPCHWPHVNGVLNDGGNVLVAVFWVEVNILGDDLEVSRLEGKWPFVISVNRFGEISLLWQKVFFGYLIKYLATFCTNFGIFMLRGKLSLLWMAKDWTVLQPSGHTVCDTWWSSVPTQSPSSLNLNIILHWVEALV